ncbi:fibronectin type III domain-containing protein [Archangium violaceum]|uniref:fibronectin type III domain-containing protein n=1 Tax=Archangium violaceum TaxID=83451 RepID=UPI0036DE19DE
MSYRVIFFSVILFFCACDRSLPPPDAGVEQDAGGVADGGQGIDGGTMTDGGISSASWPTGAALTLVAVSEDSADVMWSAADNAVAYVLLVDGAEVLRTASDVRAASLSSLRPGTTYTVRVEALGADNALTTTGPSHTFMTEVTPDVQAPTWRSGSAFLAEPKADGVSLSWTEAIDNIAVASYLILVDGSEVATVGSVSNATIVQSFELGSHDVEIVARDARGNVSVGNPRTTFIVKMPTPPSFPQPSLTLTEVGSHSVALTWNKAVDDVAIAHYTVQVNGVDALTVGPLAWGARIRNLSPATTYVFGVVAVDDEGTPSAGPTATATTTHPPGWPEGVRLSGSATTTSVALSWNGLPTGATELLLTRDGVLVTTLPPSATTHTVNGLLPGETFGFALQARDGDGQVSDDGPVLRVSTPPLSPPEPSRVAPTQDPTLPMDFNRGFRFLVEGDDPVQSGVRPGSLDDARIAVVRGRVLDRDNEPVPGVTVKVKDHPEWGRTFTRSDGRYDLLVNAELDLVLELRREDLLPVQRDIHALRHGFVALDDIIVVALDSVVTSVVPGASMTQVARSSTQGDADGSRTATMLFPAGTDATAVLANGSQVRLDQLSIRATEYTVGAKGPATMPGTLPSSSAYTYAVELSVDEALVRNASTVRFNQPVPVYVENFLGFSVGGAVPAGFYDRAQGHWVAGNDGVVLAVVDIVGGKARLDTDGDGLPDPTARLLALGIDDAERQRLATLYSPGTTLWRVGVDHFTPWDCNWPYAFPPDAEPPPDDPPEDDDSDDEDECEGKGSIIGCESRSLRERIPVEGTPFSLWYSSDRTARVVRDTLRVPVTDATVSPSLVEARVKIVEGGRVTEARLPPTPHQVFTYTSPRTDAYGRPIHGTSTVEVTVEHLYRPFYYGADSLGFSQSFARAAGEGFSYNAARPAAISRVPAPDGNERSAAASLVVSRTTRVGLGRFNRAPSSTLGGWTLDIHHLYDRENKTLLLGDGTRQRAPLFPAYNDVIASNIQGTGDMAIGPDGAFYFIESNLGRVRRIDPVTRAITTVAGNGKGLDGLAAPWDPSHDALPGPQVPIGRPNDIEIGPDGLLYIATTATSYVDSQSMVRKLLPDGRLERVAGNGCQYTGWYNPTLPAGVPLCAPYNGQPSPSPFDSGQGALDFKLSNIKDLTVDRDGSIYFNVYRMPLARIRDGRLTFPVGLLGTLGPPDFIPHFVSFGGPQPPAPGTALSFELTRVFAARNGEVLFSEYGGTSNSFLHLRGDGTVEAFWGRGEASLGCVHDADWMPDGTVVALVGPVYSNGSCFSANRLVRVGSGGKMETIALVDSSQYPENLLVAPDGSIYVSSVFRLERVSTPSLALNADFVPSPDGREASFFDGQGRLLEIRDMLTGVPRWRFFHDGTGHLIRIDDEAGRQTKIEYASGIPTAIISPDGLRTGLRVDGGMLTAVTHPDGRKTVLDYDGELLTSLQRPGSGRHQYRYDANGRLARDEGPEGNYTELAYNHTAKGFVVNKTTPDGTTVIDVSQTAAGEKRVVTSPSGEVTTTLTELDGTVTTTQPDGTVTRVVTGPDPRFGTRAPIPAEVTLTTPGGISRTVKTQVTATFSFPGDPSSLATLTTRVTVDGSTQTTTYSRATQTLTRTSAAGRTETVRYDALGHVSQVSIMPGGALASLGYDAQGRLVSHTVSRSSLTRRHTSTWDERGRTASLTEADLHTATLGYGGDSFFPNRLTLADNSGASMSHDGDGRLVNLTPDGSGTWTFRRDAEGRVSSFIPPLVGHDETVSYAWTPSGLRAGMAWSDGRELTSTYSRGRLLSVNGPSGTMALDYDATSGQLLRMTNSSSTLHIERDGPLLVARAWTGAVSGRVAYTYDARLRPASISVDGGASYTLSRDPDALITAAGDLRLGRDATTGLMSTLSLGAVSSAYAFNAVHELTTSAHKVGTATRFMEELGYDDTGRITSQRITDPTGTRTWAFTYDDAGRLTSTSLDGQPQETWSHDGNGNRMEVVKEGVPVATSHDAQDRLTTFGGASYGWDVRGRLATRTDASGMTTYTYDELGALLSVALPGGHVISYAYDAEGRRIARFVNGVFQRGYLWDGSLRLAAEVDAHGAVLATYVYVDGINAPEAVIRAGETFRIIGDHLGTPRLVLRASDGAIVQSLDWDPLGRLLSDSAPGTLPFGFAGGLFDADTGLVRLGARDYDPVTGRFLARDPLGFDGGQLNLYQYAFGDPVNRMDPTGLVSGRCLARDYLKKHGKDAWMEALNDRRQRERQGNFSEELRNAEHYLYANEQVSGNSYNWGVMHMLTLGYSAIKATSNAGGRLLNAMGLDNPSPWRGSPATLDELLDGFAGSNDALFGPPSDCGCK